MTDVRMWETAHTASVLFVLFFKSVSGSFVSRDLETLFFHWMFLGVSQAVNVNITCLSECHPVLIGENSCQDVRYQYKMLF